MTPNAITIDTMYLPKANHCTRSYFQPGASGPIIEDITVAEHEQLTRELPVVYEDGGYFKFDVDSQIARAEIAMVQHYMAGFDDEAAAEYDELQAVYDDAAGRW